MTPCAAIAQALTRSPSVRRVPRARSPSGAALSSALLPSLSGSPCPSERPRQLLLTLLRPQFEPALSLQSP
jgi:hypothetical protein